jgi:hypothetical protein
MVLKHHFQAVTLTKQYHQKGDNMKWHKHESIEAFQEYDKMFCFNAIQWACSFGGRYGADGTIENSVTKERVSIDTITIDNYDSQTYPLYGRKAWKLNHVDGYTTAQHSPKLSTDGFYYSTVAEDITIPGVPGDENSGVPSIPDNEVPMTSFYANCVYLEEVTTEPEWKIEE